MGLLHTFFTWLGLGGAPGYCHGVALHGLVSGVFGAQVLTNHAHHQSTKQWYGVEGTRSITSP